MAYTVYNTHSTVQIGTEALIRPFAFGTNWSFLRIGVLMSVNAPDPSVVSLPAAINAPVLGLCTGNKAIYDTGVTDAIWMPLFSTGVTGWTLGGTPPAAWLYHSSGLGTAGVQKVGSTASNMGAATTSSQVLTLSPSLRCFMLLDIAKGTVGNASLPITMRTVQNATASADRTTGEFLDAMERSTPVNAGSDSFTATLPLRTAKDWDSMFVAWVRDIPVLNVHQMAVTRFT